MTQLQVIARYTVAFGNELEVASLLTQLADATRTEPGNVSFEAYRGLSDEREIVLLERYESLSALTSHRASSYYKDLVVEQIVPRLDKRVVETFAVDEALQSEAGAGGADVGGADVGGVDVGGESSGVARGEGAGGGRGVGPASAEAHRDGPEVVVRDNPESQTYDAMVGDAIAGTLLYEHEGARLVLTHTAVQPSFQHRGIATTLMAAALDDIRASIATLKFYIEQGFIGRSQTFVP